MTPRMRQIPSGTISSTNQRTSAFQSPGTDHDCAVGQRAMRRACTRAPLPPPCSHDGIPALRQSFRTFRMLPFRPCCEISPRIDDVRRLHQDWHKKKPPCCFHSVTALRSIQNTGRLLCFYGARSSRHPMCLKPPPASIGSRALTASWASDRFTPYPDGAML